MQNRQILIAVAVAAIVVIFAGVVATTLYQAPSDEGAETSTESENRGNDSGVAAPAGPTDTPAPPQ